MEPQATPLISCIMPTYNRRAFVPHAIRYFLRQTYPHKELIILDDGTDKVEDLIPQMPNIRYYPLDQKITLGAKLNLGCAHAQGSIVAHWDDDDWYAPHRLDYQRDALKHENVFLCGINQLLYMDLESGKSYEYRYPEKERVWLSGSSLMYRKSYWSHTRFEDINAGMDALFVWQTTRTHLVVLAKNTFAVHMIHGQNVSPKHIEGPWWHPAAVDKIRVILQEDWPIYADGLLQVTKATPVSQASSFAEPIREKVPSRAASAADDNAAAKADFDLRTEDNSLAVPIDETVPSRAGTLSSANVAAGDQTGEPRNVFACLVHEKPECVIDLVRNLQHHDPSSIILLYNGGSNATLFQGCDFAGWNDVYVYPHPQPVAHGYLHQFALRCMKYALQHFHVDLITTVDSDQMLIRKNYSESIRQLFHNHARLGMLSSDPKRIETPKDNKWVASTALLELELWRPFLKCFPNGESKFVHWTFWPATVFSAAAARELVRLFDENALLKQIMLKTKIWGTEEVILPTLVSLAGFDIGLNPSTPDYIQYQVQHSVAKIERAFDDPAAFWVHPVARSLEDPIRKRIRQKQRDEALVLEPAAKETVSLPGPARIIEQIRSIEGWLSDAEADLLMAVMLKACIALGDKGSIVEIGAYHGKSTVLFGLLLQAYFPNTKIFSIDPHDGRLGAADTGIDTFPPSYNAFLKNLRAAGIECQVEVIRDIAANVHFNQPVILLLIDGLHDFANVSRDFEQFEKCLLQDSYIVFHDYADYYPGVKKFVHALLESGYATVALADTLMVLQRTGSVTSGKPIARTVKLKADFPQIIHQSWKSNDIPHQIYPRHWIDSWKINYPHWQYILWTDADNDELVRTSYPQFYSFYTSLQPAIKKADFSRFLYMHKWGGLYVDLDFISLKNMYPLLADWDIVLGRLSPENDYYHIPNAFMASRPGNDFWLQVARDAQQAPPEEHAVEKHAGPFRLQWAFEKYRPQQSIALEHEVVYPFDWIHLTNWHRGKFYRPELKKLIDQLKHGGVDEISKHFPKAYCFTFWTHNW